MGFIGLACALAAFHIYTFIAEPSVRMLGAALISAGALVPAVPKTKSRAADLPAFRNDIRLEICVSPRQ
jgi:hypothetical protein